MSQHPVISVGLQDTQYQVFYPPPRLKKTALLFPVKLITQKKYKQNGLKCILFVIRLCLGHIYIKNTHTRKTAVVPKVRRPVSLWLHVPGSHFVYPAFNKVNKQDVCIKN